MDKKRIKNLFPLFAGLAVLLTGCHALNDQFFAKVPFLPVKTDHVPGLDAPNQRKKEIQRKGEKGAIASEAEKEILVAQLVYEYQTSPDPNMRREAVDALAKIPHSDRDRYLQKILQDENPFVRLSALEALGKTYSGSKENLTALLINQIKTDTDKDVRVAAVRILGDVPLKTDMLKNRDTITQRLNHSTILELGDLLQDRVPAVRYEAMGSLKKITGKDYGHDINRWLQYIRYTKGELPELPSERSLAEKMPSIALPMFK